MGAAVLAVMLAGTSAVACSSDAGKSQNGSQESVQGPFAQAAAENQSRKVADRFGHEPQVLADSDASGVEASKLFFDESTTAVVSGPSATERLRAASIGVASSAPVLRTDGRNGAAIAAELGRLGVEHVLVVGDVDLPKIEKDGKELNPVIIKDPGTQDAVAKLTARQFQEAPVAEPKKAAEAVAGLDEKSDRLLTPQWEHVTVKPRQVAEKESEDAPQGDHANQEGQDGQEAQGDSAATESQGQPDANAEENSQASDAASQRAESPAASAEKAEKRDGEKKQSEDVKAFPAQSPRDGGQSPVVLASPDSSIPAVATARAFGADVNVLSFPDPRVTHESMEKVAGLSEGPVVALGSQFGDADTLRGAIKMGEEVTAEFPGGGELLLPGRRMIAPYGHPGDGGSLGLLGEFPPEQATEKAKELVGKYQEHSEEPVIPSFEIIASVAAAEPGPDGNYSNEADPEVLKPYVDAIVNAGGYAIIDLQPGTARFVDQAKKYEDLLKQPNVGLALDSEWKLHEGEKPAEQVGHVDAEEINEVSDWLAGLVRENKLPQKGLMLHQFQSQMLRNRETINTKHPELSYILHADGHGTSKEKFETWNVLLKDLDPRILPAWKNFLDEDKPTFSPEQTFNINPKPWLVSYQ